MNGLRQIMKCAGRAGAWTALVLSLFGCAGSGAYLDSEAVQRPIFSQERLRLTSAYDKIHYGEECWRLVNPKMIVVHYTAFPTIKESLSFFEPPLLDRKLRKDIAAGGEVNVSTHYLVDKSGRVYQLAPEDVVCRHTIGFNYTALAIENVGSDASELTEAQAGSTAALISRMVARHPGIEYLIGHHEYRDASLPHYRLLREKDSGYRFTDKIDPGPAFMARVRQLLREEYGVCLKK